MEHKSARLIILVSAFEPFGGRGKNASAEALAQLACESFEMADIRTTLLPVETEKAFAQLRVELERIQPDILLCLGEAKRDALCLETTGYNERRFSIPDNAGHTLDGTPINSAGPASYPSTLPLDQMLQAVGPMNIPVCLSDDPGRYLCNEVLYSALDYVATHNLPVRVGFIHIPHLPEAATEDPDYPTMPTEQVVLALCAVIEILLRQADTAKA
jgi:pyroglutamyl-peptidase